MPVLLALLSSCTGMVQQELDDTHAKLAALQSLVSQVNQNLTSLQQIVSELDDGHTVTAVTPMDPDGYDLSFKDGKVVRISYGQDGEDGIVHPLGVKAGEDGLYYWTVDEDFMTDAEGNPVRAVATDGEDAVVPVLKVDEDGNWLVSLDGGGSFDLLAAGADLEGVGVFKDAYEETDKVCLVQWNGDVLELPKYVPVRVSFKDGSPRDTIRIAGGETLRIPFEILVEGDTEDPLVVTSGTDGTYFSEVVMGTEPGKGEVVTTAPEAFQEGYIFLSAFCDGYSALKKIVFQPRVVNPADAVVVLRIGQEGGSLTVPYEANFDYSTVVAPEGEDWLTVVPDPEGKTVTFQFEPNAGSEVRSCEVTVTPDEYASDYVCTTFRVYQATKTLTVDTPEIEAPAAGGDFDVWVTASMEITPFVPETFDWITAELVPEDGFLRLKVHVDPLEEGSESRTGSVQLRVGTAPVREIKIVQKS